MRLLALTGIVLAVAAGCASSPGRPAAEPAVPHPQAVAAPPPTGQAPPTAPVITPAPAASAASQPIASNTTTAPARAVAAAPPKPPVACRQYLLQTSGNWWLRVDRDGGGAYGYGGSPEDRATFGAGTFDFKSLGQTLREKMTMDASFADATAVTLTSMRGDPTDGTLADDPLVRSLFDRAKAHRQGDLARLDHLESSFPVLPQQTGRSQ